MSDLSIGINGIRVALKSIEIIGNNMANAATEGYHRQRVIIEPVTATSTGGLDVGSGAQVTQLSRQYDDIVEKELLRQQPMMAGVGQELDTLQSVESVFGDMTAEGLGSSIEQFFNVLTELSGQPLNATLRDQAVWSADGMAIQFHNVSAALSSMKSNLDAETSNLVDQVNNMTSEVADLNSRIRALYYRGGVDNNLIDRRDQIISQLSELADVQVGRNGDGTTNLVVGGASLVIIDRARAVELGNTPDGNRCLTLAGAKDATLQIENGRIGAILNLNNRILPGIQGDLDNLAKELVQNINQAHVQGLGVAGSFTQLSGWHTESSDLTQWNPPLTAGTIQVRITDTATGAAVRNSVAVDPSTDTLDDVAARLDALTGLKAQVIDSRLCLSSETGYKFDFSAALLPQPSSGGLTGAAQPAISGTYTGAANQALTFTVAGAGGNVGVTDALTVRVTNADGDLITNLNVGSGYAAGDTLAVVDGVRVAFGAGDLKAGETFGVDAIANADTSGFLAGAGLNTFFSGNSASTINVMDDLRESSDRLATAATAGGTDNLNVRAMAAVGETTHTALDNATPGNFFQKMVTDLGQQIALRQGRKDGFDNSIQQLSKQRDDASGVDLNEEAAQLLVCEQLFQSMAKYLTISDKTMQTLFDIVTAS
ncbi:MAG: flagellar hook-associated protein FlgK [Planctomycetota bacterium]|nr:flagellar hook-associated protein FlgK [Planctomycetota bacterium]